MTDLSKAPAPTAAPPPAPSRVDDLLTIQDDPRRPVEMLPEDWSALLGSAIAAVSLVWVVFFRLLPLDGPVGFWILSWLTFVAIYYQVVRSTHGPLAARDRVAAVVMSTVAAILFSILVLIIGYVVAKGLPAMSAAFFTQTLEGVGPLDPISKGGALHAIVGTLQQVGITVVISVPLGVTTAIFLNEVGGRLARPVRTLVDAMSGVPSIVAGLFIYSSLILALGWGFSGFAASLALTVLMLPTVTRTCEEVLRLVPDGLREAALALGAPRWRVALQVVLPTARSGVSTAVILGIARAVGETAPLILTTFGASVLNPNPFSEPQASLPLYVFQLVRSSEQVDKDRAWAGSFALIMLVLILFTLARWAGRKGVGGGRPSATGLAATAATDPTIDPAFSAPARPRRRRGRRSGAAVPDDEASPSDDPALRSHP